MRRREAIARTVAALTACAALRALAAGVFVEDIRVSKRGDEATVTVELACPMRFQSDARTVQGVLLEVRVSPLESCRQLGSADISSEVYRPAGGQLAHLTEVEYDSLGLGEHLLMFHFDRPVDYRVAQRGDLRTLQLIVRLDAAPPALVAPPEPEAAPPRAGPPATTVVPAPAPSGRAPLSPRVRAPGGAADYVVNLLSQREAIGPEVIAGLGLAPDRKPYVSEAEIDGKKWYRLRVGFFASEREARTALEPLAARFPRAWIGRAEHPEVELASSYELAPGGLVAARPAAEQETAATLATPAAGAGTLTLERIAALQADGRDALLSQDYDAAVRVYTRLLQEPGDHRAEAREYLGLARERHGQVAQARAEYRAYLEEFPDGEGARRVEQRLGGLVPATAAAQRAPLRKAEPDSGSRWDVATGVSQYYRRDTDQFDADLPWITSLEAVMTDLDVNVRRTGGRVDWLARASINNLYDLMGEERRGPGNLNRISYAYVDAGAAGDWAVRVGRQTLHNWGVLGRFDGVHFSYDWAPERRLHFTSGYPVESTRNGLRTDRQFYGVAVDFDHLVGSWDFSTSINEQTIGGIDDRKAVGFEARYLDDVRSLTSLVDYDYDYGKLNTTIVLGTWRFANRLTLTGLVDVRASPVLTTRNALIGQPVTTVDELLLVWTEDELHQLARDRTADSKTVTLGFAKPLFERFQINADVTTMEIGATVESFGVPAMPGTGQQTYYSTSFVGSGLFGSGDVNIFTLRHGVADTFTTSQLTWDARFPVGRRVRLNPRLRLATWESVDGRRRETTSPSFRLLVNTGSHYRLEVELGSDEFLRTDRTTRQDSTGDYVNVGYRADF